MFLKSYVWYYNLYMYMMYSILANVFWSLWDQVLSNNECHAYVQYLNCITLHLYLHALYHHVKPVFVQVLQDTQVMAKGP